MPEINPYAPPSHDDAPLGRRATNGAGVWQSLGVVVLLKEGGRLPDRCVRCNAPSTFRLKKRLSWHHPAIYALIFVGVFFYIVAALVFRKVATVEFGLCEKHLQQRQLGMALSWGGVALSLTLIVAGGMADLPALIISGLGLFAVLFVAGVALAQVAFLKKIDDEAVRFTAGRPFVESLPRRPL